MNSSNINIQIGSDTSKANNELDKLIEKLKSTGNEVTSISQKVGKDGQSIISTVKSIQTQGNYLQKQVKSIDQNGNLKNLSATVIDTSKSAQSLADRFQGVVNKVETLGGLTIVFASIKSLMDNITELETKSINYSEELNLFNVVFGNIEKNGVTTFSEIGKKATEFQAKMQNNFGTSRTESMEYQALYQEMANQQGIADQYANIMSENTTKLTYDLSSLFNKNQDEVAEELRAGIYAGQTKPLRALGLDVTETSLKSVLEDLKATNSELKDLNVATMSQGEKQILRYIAVLQQSKKAWGDYANTIESPANQLKMLKDQLEELAVAIGNLFVGAFQKSLVTLNAIVMTVKGLVMALGTLFGITPSDYNTSIATTSDYYDDEADSVGKATSAVKELKRETLSFDQIHNLTTPTSSGSSGGSGSTNNGISQALLDSLKGYNNKLNETTSKARKIADNMLEWLGITKQVNSATGEITYKFKSGITNIKIIGVAIASLIGLKLVSWISSGIIGFNKMFSTTTKAGEAISVLTGKAVTTTKTFSTMLPIMGKVTLGLGGIALTILGSAGTYNAVKNLTKGTGDATKNLVQLTLGLGSATAGGALFGSMFGPLGAIIGAVSGAVISAGSGLVSYYTTLRQVAESKTFGDLTVSTEQWLDILNQMPTSITNVTPIVDTYNTSMSGLKDTFYANASAVEYLMQKNQALSSSSTEDIQSFVDNITSAGNTATSAIDASTKKDYDLMSAFFKDTNRSGTEESNNILDRIIKTGESSKQKIQSAQDDAITIWQNAKNTRGYLTDEEMKRIQKDLDEIRADVNQTLSQGKTESNFILSSWSDDVNNITKESYDNLSKAEDEYRTEQNEYWVTYYNEQSNLLKRQLSDGTLIQKEYDDNMKILNEERVTGQKNIENEIALMKDKAFNEILAKYHELDGKTESEVGEQRRLLIGMLKDIKPDSTDLINSLALTGTSAGTTLSTNFKNNISFTGGYNAGQTYMNSFISGASSIKGKITYSQGTDGPICKFERTYANGGFPEDGLFMANHGELVGQFSNGKTAVANNQEITAGIRDAVMQGMGQVMSAYSGNQSIKLDIRADEGIIVEKAINGINNITDRTGDCPIRVM